MKAFVVMVYSTNPDFDYATWFPAAVFDNEADASAATASINTALGGNYCEFHDVERNPEIPTHTQPLYRVIADFDGDGKHTARPPDAWVEWDDPFEPCDLSRLIPPGHNDEHFIHADSEEEAIAKLRAMKEGQG